MEEYITNNNKEGQYSLKFKLDAEKFQEDALEKIFRTVNTVYSDMWCYMRRIVHEMENRPDFKKTLKYLSEYRVEKKQCRYEHRQKSEVSLNRILGMKSHFILSSPSFVYSYKNCAYITSQLLGAIEQRIGKSIESYFKNPKSKHINRNNIDYICSPKKVTNEVSYYSPFFFNDGIFSISYKKKNAKKINFKIKVEDDDYLRRYALEHCEIRSLGIERVFKRGKYIYYAVIGFKGEKSINNKHHLGKGCVGIDPSQTCIYYDMMASNGCIRLGDKEYVDKIQKKISLLNRKLDRSKRAVIPENFNKDGTVKKGSQWYKLRDAKNYQKLKSQLSTLRSRLSDYIKKNQYNIAGFFVDNCDTVKYEENSYHSLAARAKGVRKNKKGKIEKNKRFGKSIGVYAPYQFMTILQEKINDYGGTFIKIPAKNNASTQFDHTDGSFTKHPISERSVMLSNGDYVDRDLHSAFNIRHCRGGVVIPISGITASSYKNEVSKIPVKTPENYDIEEMEYEYELMKNKMKKNIAV